MNEIQVIIIEFGEFFDKSDYRRSIGSQFKGLIFVDESDDGEPHVSFYSDYAYRVFSDLAGRIIDAEEKRLLIAGKTNTAEQYIAHLRSIKAMACSAVAAQGIWMSCAIKRPNAQKPEKADVLAGALKSQFYVGQVGDFHEWIIPLRGATEIAFLEAVTELDYGLGDYRVVQPRYLLSEGVKLKLLEDVRGCQPRQVSLVDQPSLVQTDLFGEVCK